jgi:hypothetical protein
MTTQTNNEYFEWLTSQIYINNNRTYNDLFERLHETEFIWTIANDDNRVQDGLDLRAEFLDAVRGEAELPQGASVLEVLIALSRTMAFTAGGNPRIWAWKLLRNLKLNKSTDPLTGEKAARVEEILEALIWRTYSRNGQGGFFPLREPHEDQTKVELWYQMNAYVMENEDA